MIDTDIVVGSGLKATVARAELAERLGVVARAVSTRSAVQVLLGVLIRAEAGQLHLAATDMELSLRASLDAEIATRERSSSPAGSSSTSSGSSPRATW
jgi:DNA polymerase III subunit beta